MKTTAEPSPLFAAVLSSDIDGMRAATAAGADLNERDSIGMTPLLFAVYRGDVEAVSFLLGAGADPNMADANDSSCTPLWHAEEDFGLTEIASILRAYGARP